jgi:hypothetical protein
VAKQSVTDILSQFFETPTAPTDDRPPNPTTATSDATQFDSEEFQRIMAEQKRKQMERDIRYSRRHDQSVLTNYLLTLDIFNIEKDRLKLGRAPAEIGTVFTDGQAYIDAFRNLYLEEVRAEIENALRDIDLVNRLEVRLINKPGPVYANYMNLLPQGPDFSDKFRPDDYLFFMEATPENLTGIPNRFAEWQRPRGHTFLGIVE